MINYIYARDAQYGIGKKNRMPWHCSQDLKRFSKLTSQNIVVMGRKTWDSLPEKYKPLPNRLNVVLSKTMPASSSIAIMDDPLLILEKIKKLKMEAFVIGGSQIFKVFEPYVEKVYETHIKGNYNCDVFYKQNLSQFNLIEQQEFEDHIFKVWKK